MPFISGGGSGGAGGLTRLFDSGTLQASAASIDTGANGIAGGHVDLFVSIYLRSDRAAAQDNVTVRFNNDGGGNYDVNRLLNTNTTVAGTSTAATTSIAAGTLVPSASETAGQFGTIQLWIPSYDNTTGFKIATTLNATPSQTVAQSNVAEFAGSWRNTAAITRIAVAPVAGTNFVAGSRMVVYGCQ